MLLMQCLQCKPVASAVVAVLDFESYAELAIQ
jgi:hypothetical protein